RSVRHDKAESLVQSTRRIDLQDRQGHGDLPGPPLFEQAFHQPRPETFSLELLPDQDTLEEDLGLAIFDGQRADVPTLERNDLQPRRVEALVKKVSPVSLVPSPGRFH